MRSFLPYLFGPKVDQDTLYALNYKIPNVITVGVHEEADGSYVAIVHNLGGTVVTQGKDGLELFEMVNDAVFTALDIPQEYRLYLPALVPPDEVRKTLRIPAEFLSKELELVKA